MQVYSEYYTDSHILNSITVPKEKVKLFIYKVMFITQNVKHILQDPANSKTLQISLIQNCQTQTHSYYITELMLFHDPKEIKLAKSLIYGCGSVFIMKGEPKRENLLCLKKKVREGKHSGRRGC
jgi:hypothetical protein